MNSDQDNISTPIAADLIWGAVPIGEELGVGRRRAFYLLENRQIPAKKIGGTWVASRRELREHFSGKAA